MENIMGLATTAAYPVSLDAKRRPTLPAALLSQAHIEPGEDLIAIPAGDGAILLQNRSAALARARAHVREGFKAPVAQGAVDRFQHERRTDHERRDTRSNAQRSANRPEAAAAEHANERGAAMLAELGL